MRTDWDVMQEQYEPERLDRLDNGPIRSGQPSPLAIATCRCGAKWHRDEIEEYPNKFTTDGKNLISCGRCACE